MQYDYIVIGSGSGGAAVAGRLSEDSQTSVLLLEAGGRDRHPFIHIPALFPHLLTNPKTTWTRKSEPVPGLNGRKMYFPSGKVLGGSSSINGMLYIRGQAQDYDDWRDAGNAGWGWDDVLPYFKKMEDHEHGENAAHGVGGPIAVTDTRPSNDASFKFLDAAVATGIPRIVDLNTGDQHGIATVQGTIRNGRRSSTAQGYLKPAKGRANLTIQTQANVTRLLLDGKRVSGVEYRDGDGAIVTVQAGREVILAASAVGSPQILLQSGIGDSAELKAVGVEPLHHLPGVGKNLHDHLFISVQTRLKPAYPTLNQLLSNKPRMAMELLRYGALRTGAFKLTSCEICGFLNSEGKAARPDIQITFRPFSFDFTSKGGFAFHSFPGGTASICFTRPKSRGAVSLMRENDGLRAAIQPNYLDRDEDVQGMLRGLKILRRIINTEPFAGYLEGEHGAGATAKSDEEMIEHIRDNAATIYHPVGTCKMGNDEMCVVDDHLRVRGLSGLRIADASVMPGITSGNTNAPAIMVGEKCADMIRGERNR
ncbi:MAG: GMC family oxidoreductase N-terminal domain-containing protein [Alphaproteobacteria bacterium]|nr:GMC family oxidoreductase N-terminal domain-containing protein [Alphaproteobacteria bacterium]